MTEPHDKIRPRPGVMDIAPYIGGASHVEGAEKVVKLSSNENPWGASPKAVAAYQAAAADLAAYPDPGCADLRAAIADAHGLEADRIICGAGSDELIALLCQAYAGEGDEVVYSRHGFLMYPISALANGATPVTAAETDLTADVDNLLAACTGNTRLVFLANPNNPTGTRLNAQELTRLAAGIPDRALLVVDAAYAEFVGEDDYDSGIALVRRRDNVVMTRTFSKIYGLAALRVAWLYGPDHVIDVLHRVRGPFNVSAPAQAAAAAAMRDAEFTAACAAKNRTLRERFRADLAALGVPTTPSSANFVLAEFGTGDRGAAAADAFLKSKGIIARRMESYGLAAHLRISIGDEAACAAVTAALKEFLA
jgi:histidinol-phosphate aminotransferase